MSNKQFAELLESGEGLTQQFKESAAKIFEQAVQEGIEARYESEVEKLKESLYQEVAEQGASLIKEELEKKSVELEEQSHKTLETTITEKFRDHFEQLTEQAQEAEDKLVKETAKYKNELAKLNESVEQLAAEKSTEEVLKLEKKLCSYADYIAEQYVAATADTVKMTTKAWLGEQIIGHIKDLLESYGVESPEGLEAYNEQIKDLKEQRDSAYDKLSSVIEENHDLECELNESKKATALAVISEGMSISDRNKLAEMLEECDIRDVSEFSEKAKMLREQFGSEESAVEQPKLHLESVNIVSDKPIIEEKVEQKVQQNVVQESVDPEVDYFLNALKAYR